MGHVTKPSKATRFNEHMLKRLQKAVALDPEEDIRDSLDASAAVETIYPLSKVVFNILEDVSRAFQTPSDSFSERLIRMMQASEILWRGPSARYKMYTTLQYLRQHQPSIPILEPLGLLRFNGIVLSFMSYQPGNTLTNVWRALDKLQKAYIQEQLNNILIDLRSLPFTSGTLLRGYRSGGDTFVSLMRELCPPTSSCRIVFTHGDLHPDNITVEMAGDRYIVTGLIDWEYSGFYPEYYEAAKSTNCLSPYEEDDWYLFLPDCVSPKRYAPRWLLDRVRETSVV
ncbi:kinase-like domain-containing protein [Aspergillus crustosus]